MRPIFEDHIISRRADVVWPPRSWDLTPLDYYLCVCLFHTTLYRVCCIEYIWLFVNAQMLCCIVYFVLQMYFFFWHSNETNTTFKKHISFTQFDSTKPIQLLKTYEKMCMYLDFVSCMLYWIHLVVCERSNAMLYCALRIPNVFFCHSNDTNTTFEKHMKKMCGISVSDFYMKIINNKLTLLYNRPTIHSLQRYNGLCELTNCVLWHLKNFWHRMQWNLNFSLTFDTKKLWNKFYFKWWWIEKPIS